MHLVLALALFNVNVELSFMFCIALKHYNLDCVFVRDIACRLPPALWTTRFNFEGDLTTIWTCYLT